MYKPHQPLGWDIKALTNLKANGFDRICDALARIAQRLNTRNDNASVRKVNTLYDADAIRSVASSKCEEIRLVGHEPERKAPRSSQKCPFVCEAAPQRGKSWKFREGLKNVLCSLRVACSWPVPVACIERVTVMPHLRYSETL